MARSRIDNAIATTRAGEYLQALNLFLEFYGTMDDPPIETAKSATGLSFFGLCIALVSRKFKHAIDLCNRAIFLEFYNADHYANLARVYIAAEKRKKAIEILERGLKLVPEHESLLEVRKELGVRARPAVPFLDRSHPVNVRLGFARRAAQDSPKKK